MRLILEHNENIQTERKPITLIYFDVLFGGELRLLSKILSLALQIKSYQ